jgi:hypothetical protein
LGFAVQLASISTKLPFSVAYGARLRRALEPLPVGPLRKALVPRRQSTNAVRRAMRSFVTSVSGPRSSPDPVILNLLLLLGFCLFCSVLVFVINFVLGFAVQLASISTKLPSSVAYVGSQLVSPKTAIFLHVLFSPSSPTWLLWTSLALVFVVSNPRIGNDFKAESKSILLFKCVEIWVSVGLLTP